MSNNGTLNLWKQLKKSGNFSDSDYDKCIIDQLKDALSATDNIEETIQEISEERFLICFFKTLSPLITMYTDILNFFERCGANTSYKNIEIRIESKTSGFVNFNADYFTHAKETIIHIKKLLQKVKLTADGVKIFWKFSECKRNNVGKFNLTNESLNKWHDIYNKETIICPNVKIDFDDIIKNSSIKDTPVKNALSKAYVFWKALYDYFKSNNLLLREDLRTFLENQKEDNDNKEILRQENDYILDSALGTLYYIAEKYASLSNDKQDEIMKILNEFDNYFFDVPSDILFKKIENFLKLPVWEHRHELYSVWIFTRMIADFHDDDLSFDIKNNTLSFTFSKELILSAKLNGVKIDFWNELRTEVITPLLGEGRKNNIQPDYSIVCGCADDINSCIAVVECKHYKKPNYTNFSQAIIDYANNRPNAKIFLVNYGEFDVQKLTSKNSIGKNKYKLLPLCRPESNNSNLLSKYIWELVHKHAGINPCEQTCVNCINS